MNAKDRPVLAIFGPTASGKSAVADALADRIPADIVSADSMQVYRGLAILTNQPSTPTKLTAIWGVDHEASVGEYARLAHEAIDDSRARGRTPIVVGGTGLYLRAALADLGLPAPPEPRRRAHFDRLYERLGPEASHALLAERDAGASAAVHPNDRRRVVRALELAAAGETLTPSSSRLWMDDARHPTLVFGLEVPRDVLETRIEARTQRMVELGVQQEAARALAHGPSSTARHVIGLRELGELPWDEAMRALMRRTLQYAAYQRKWMRRIPGLVLLDGDRAPEEIADELLALAAERFPLLRQQEGRPSGIREGETDQTGQAV